MKKSLLLLTCALVASQAFAGGPLRADTDQHNFRPSTNVSFSETTLPIVYITVDGQIIQRESRVLATMKIIDNGDDSMTEEEAAELFTKYIEPLLYKGK